MKSSWLPLAVAALGGTLFRPVVAQSAETPDAGPTLISRTAGGVAWKNLAELKSAAAAGNPQACAQLGEELLQGGRVPKDGAQALPLLEQAARKGVGSAAFRLGMLLDDGEIVARDRTRALEYFRAAAAGDGRGRLPQCRGGLRRRARGQTRLRRSARLVDLGSQTRRGRRLRKRRAGPDHETQTPGVDRSGRKTVRGN